MPEICRFYGIVIYLYWMDHNPPHIHVMYSGYECTISIMERIIEGKIPAKVIAKVNQWIDIHQDEILKQWAKASRGESIEKIEPLI
ncbi:MAG: DUF4160 domain-containing protein [Prevotella sp.]